MHTSVTMLPATSSNLFTICQQKYEVPTASEDRHEYLCCISPIALKASRQAGTAAHLATWFPIYPASEGKYRLTASNLTERLVSRPPCCDSPWSYRCQCTGATLARELWCGDRRKEKEWWRNYNKDQIHPFLFFLPLHSAIHTNLAFGPHLKF